MENRSVKIIKEWLSGLVDIVSTYTFDEQIVGHVYFFHTGTWISVEVVSPQEQANETRLSLTTNSFNSF